MKNLVSDLFCFLLEWLVVAIIIGIMTSIVGGVLYMTYNIWKSGNPFYIIIWVVVIFSFFVTLSVRDKV